jgi:hypothetical protein
MWVSFSAISAWNKTLWCTRFSACHCVITCAKLQFADILVVALDQEPPKSVIFLPIMQKQNWVVF